MRAAPGQNLGRAKCGVPVRGSPRARRLHHAHRRRRRCFRASGARAADAVGSLRGEQPLWGGRRPFCDARCTPRRSRTCIRRAFAVFAKARRCTSAWGSPPTVRRCKVTYSEGLLGRRPGGPRAPRLALRPRLIWRPAALGACRQAQGHQRDRPRWSVCAGVYACAVARHAWPAYRAPPLRRRPRAAPGRGSSAAAARARRGWGCRAVFG